MDETQPTQPICFLCRNFDSRPTMLLCQVREQRMSLNPAKADQTFAFPEDCEHYFPARPQNWTPASPHRCVTCGVLDRRRDAPRPWFCGKLNMEMPPGQQRSDCDLWAAPISGCQPCASKKAPS